MTDQTDDDFLDPETEAVVNRIDPRGIKIGRAAAGRYVEHHPDATGASPWQAREQIRELLADMLDDDRTQWERPPDKLLTATLKGYWLGLVPNGEAVVAYGTLHRFRTWQQVKAGVASPVAADKRHRRTQRNLDLFTDLMHSAGATVRREESGHTLHVTGPEGTATVRGDALTSRRRIHTAAAIVAQHLGIEPTDPAPDDEPATLREGWLILPGSEEAVPG
ncbi:hypothetical protein [Actinocorallia aurantiaca]|uniref:Uncharacterized protein n=1 Tax=Actinocorallia aurantiaca TaxID=46204 RepID=A0ABP6H278_9ACTN